MLAFIKNFLHFRPQYTKNTNVADHQKSNVYQESLRLSVCINVNMMGYTLHLVQKPSFVDWWYNFRQRVAFSLLPLRVLFVRWTMRRWYFPYFFLQNHQRNVWAENCLIVEMTCRRAICDTGISCHRRGPIRKNEVKERRRRRRHFFRPIFLPPFDLGPLLGID